MKRCILSLAAGLLLVLSACAPAGPQSSEDLIYPTSHPSSTPSSTESQSVAESQSPQPAPEVSSTPAPTESQPAETTQAEAPVWGVQESACSQSDDEDTDVLLVQGKFSLPLIENAEGVAAYEAINQWYLDLSAGLRSDTLANAGQADADYALSKSMGYAFTYYTDEESYEITHQTSQMVSILRTHYGHTGGTYPTLLYMADHFDLTTGEVLTFDDFFTDPDAAAAIALEEVLRQAAQGDANGTTYDAALAESLFKRENFYLTAGAVVFFYQPQDLAPNAAGAPTFPVPRSLFGDLLAPWA